MVSYFQVHLLFCYLNFYYGSISLEWPIHLLQQFSSVKLTHPLPDGKACAFFPPRGKNLRLDTMGRTWLLFFQSIQVVASVSPEVFVLVLGFNPKCFLSAWKHKLESYLGLRDTGSTEHLINLACGQFWNLTCFFKLPFFKIRDSDERAKLDWIKFLQNRAAFDLLVEGTVFMAT